MIKKIQIAALTVLSTGLAFYGVIVLYGPLEATENPFFVLFNVTVVSLLMSFMGARCAINQVKTIYGKIPLMFMTFFASYCMYLLVLSSDSIRVMQL